MAPKLSRLEALADEFLLNITGRLSRDDKLALRVASPRRFAPFLFGMIAECLHPSLTFWNEKEVTKARSVERQEAVLAILESSPDLARQVVSVTHVFWLQMDHWPSASLDRDQSDSQKLLFCTLAALPSLQRLNCTSLNTADQHHALEDVLARTCPKTSLTRLMLYNSTFTSTALQALLKYAPNLRQLNISESICMDGWSEAFKAIGQMSNLAEIQLGAIGVGGSSSPAATINDSPHCAAGKAKPLGDQKCRHKSRQFMINGKWEDCELHTMAIECLKGDSRIKEAMKHLLRFTANDDS